MSLATTRTTYFGVTCNAPGIYARL